MASERTGNILIVLIFAGAVGFGLYLSRRGAAPAEPVATPQPGPTGAPLAAPGGHRVELHPELVKGQVALQKADLATARAHLELVPSDHPTYTLALHNLGVLYEQAGDLEASRGAFERLTNLIPIDPDAWIGLAWAHYRLGDAAAAETANERALSLDPRIMTALYNRGLYRVALGRPKAAVEAYKAVIAGDREGAGLPAARADLVAWAEANPAASDAHYLLSLMASALGENDEAIVQLRSFLAADGGDEELRGRAAPLLEQAKAKAAASAAEELAGDVSGGRR